MTMLHDGNLIDGWGMQKVEQRRSLWPGLRQTLQETVSQATDRGMKRKGIAKGDCAAAALEKLNSIS